MKSTPRHQATNTMYLLLTLSVFVLVCAPGVIKRGIWTDEAWSMLVLSGQLLVSYPDAVITPNAIQAKLHDRASTQQTLHTLIEDDVHPPVYFLLAKVWASAFGQTLSSLRWMSVLTGLLSIFIFFHFLELYSQSLARMATPLFAFSTGVLHFSTEVRLYIVSLLGLVTTLYLMGSISNINRNRSRQDASPGWLILALILASATTVLTNYLAVFSISACYLWFMASRPNLRTGLLCGACAVLLVALWLPFLFRHGHMTGVERGGMAGLSQELYLSDYSGAGRVAALGFTGVPQQLYFALRGTLGSWFIASNIAYPTFLEWLGRVLLLGMIVLGVKPAAYSSDRPDAESLPRLFVLLAFAPAAGMVILYVLLCKQFSELRYMMLAAPGLATLGGLGILRLSRFSKPTGVFAWSVMLALLLSVANWGSATSFYQGKTNYREFADLLRRQPVENNLVIAGTGPMPGNTTALFHELPPDTHVLVLRPTSDVNAILATAAQYHDVWLVRVREKTRVIEDRLAESLSRSRKPRQALHQIEHYQ